MQYLHVHVALIASSFLETGEITLREGGRLVCRVASSWIRVVIIRPCCAYAATGGTHSVTVGSVMLSKYVHTRLSPLVLAPKQVTRRKGWGRNKRPADGAFCPQDSPSMAILDNDAPFLGPHAWVLLSTWSMAYCTSLPTLCVCACTEDTSSQVDQVGQHGSVPSVISFSDCV